MVGAERVGGSLRGGRRRVGGIGRNKCNVREKDNVKDNINKLVLYRSIQALAKL